MWRNLLPALLVAAACTGGDATAPAQPAQVEATPAPAEALPAPGDAVLPAQGLPAPGGGTLPAPPLPAPGDAALPAADEVPRFLTGRAAPPDDPPVEVELDDDVLDSWPVDEAHVREPTLQELMRSVEVGEVADEGDESWAFIGGGHREEEARSEPAVPPTPQPEVIAVDVAVPPPEQPVAVAPEEDPCAPLRRLLDKRNHYVRRTAAERDAFGYVESEEDLAALRLLQGLHRCAQHPDDEDCRQRPIEVDISEVEIPAHQIHRQPSDLNAEGKLPNEIPHDPEVLDLLHRLERCEKSQIVQPLLQR